MNERQRLFAQRYAATQSIEKSAMEAGYSENYSKFRASKVLLNNPEVIAEVKRLRERLNQTTDKSATDVVNEFAKIAFCDRIDFLKEDPHYPGEYIYKSPDELTKDQRAIVEKVTYTMHEITVIEDGQVQKHWIKSYTYVLSEKAKALEQMGRHFGIFDDKLRLGASKTNPFTNASPAQLEKLKAAFVSTMNDTKMIEGDYEEVKVNGS